MKSEMILAAVLFICLLSEVFCVPQYYRASYRARRPRPNRRFRGCQSPEETFFKGQCVLIGSSEHCPNNMQLFDGPNKNGFCNCVDIASQPAFYSHVTGECSFHNTQGPCLDDEWFVLKNGFPQCERVPDGCPADGQHFYGTPYHWMAEQCWQLRTQGPCSPNEILQVEKDARELKISCRIPINAEVAVYSSGPSSVGFQAPCRPGTRRNRHGNCRRAFYG